MDLAWFRWVYVSPLSVQLLGLNQALNLEFMILATHQNADSEENNQFRESV